MSIIYSKNSELKFVMAKKKNGVVMSVILYIVA